MTVKRRDFLKMALVMASAVAGLLKSVLAYAGWPSADFAEAPFDASMKKLLQGKTFATTDKIELTIPEIAENGALVPVTVTSSLNGIKRFVLVAQLNPVPVAIQMEFTPQLEPFLSARLKLASTCDVYALAETGQGWFGVKKKVKVTIGGCGG